MRRIASAYWVQTPNFWFPIEPHFLMPGWQWMPRAVRTELLHRLRSPLQDPSWTPLEALPQLRDPGHPLMPVGHGQFGHIFGGVGGGRLGPLGLRDEAPTDQRDEG